MTACMWPWSRGEVTRITLRRCRAQGYNGNGEMAWRASAASWVSSNSSSMSSSEMICPFTVVLCKVRRYIPFSQCRECQSLSSMLCSLRLTNGVSEWRCD